LFFYEYNRDFSNAAVLFGTIVGLILAIFAGNAVTDVLKLSVGRLRPDFLSRCQWDGEKCSGIPAVITEGRRSFPSGHSTIAFAGMSYLSLYIAGRCRLFHKNYMWQTKLVGAVSVFFSLTIAVFIGYSRIYDHWHHVTDVIAGGGLGILSASCCYIRHFYWITSNYAGISKWSAKKNQKDEPSIVLSSYEAIT
jgi:diacylglycerol diphosphate phosphatase / phosphatidate phosphatase